MAIIALVVCLPVVLGLTVNPKKPSLLSLDTESMKNRPVSKVITLLKDMTKQMEKEAEEDQEIYDKMACWCTTNDKSRTAQIKKSAAKVTSLTSKIESLEAASARLNTEIKNAEQEVAANQKSLDAATALREKELAEFNTEEKDLLESTSSLKAAITSLSKHHSMLQMPKRHVLGVAATLQHVLSKHSVVLDGILTPLHQRQLGNFLQAPSYSPQSGEIFGVLRQMKEGFESSLAKAQKEEAASQKAYEELKSAKTDEIEAGQALFDKKTQELATADSKHAIAKEDKVDTMEQQAADEAFLESLKERCSLSDKEFEERQKTRQLELEAVSKALSFLSSDDAHDLFTKTFNPSFLQTRSTDASQRRVKAASLLKSLAEKYHQPRLATLAMTVQLDAFTKVKEGITAMVEQLLKEKEDEIKLKDYCVDEFNKNEAETDTKTRDKMDASAAIEDLEHAIKDVTAAIDAIKLDVAELQVQLKRAGEEREKQNREFQETVNDQRATQQLLTQALKVLKGFYEKPEAAALVQATKLNKGSAARQAPPPGFEAYKKSSSSFGVMSMIQQIIADAKAMEAEAVHDEEDAQKTYEDFSKDTKATIEHKNEEQVHKSKIKAESEAALIAAKEDRANIVLELEQLANTKSQLHGSCDFVMKNFEVRQLRATKKWKR